MTKPEENRDKIVEGDPFGDIKTPATSPYPDAKAVRAWHTKADTDASKLALHHTLGSTNTQSAAGDHIHDGISSKKLMAGVTITGAKGGNAALANLITALASALGFVDATT